MNDKKSVTPGCFSRRFGMFVIRTVVFCLMLNSSTDAAKLTHGPMIGHTTDNTARIWVRADEECDFWIQAGSISGGSSIVSEKVRLGFEDNFCGSVCLKGLTPKTKYAYRVFLDGKEQLQKVIQEFKTFPKPGESGIVRIGFAHSLPAVPGEQITWRAIEDKKPDLFILMGDNIYSNSTEPEKQRSMYLNFRGDRYFRAFSATTPIYAIWDDHDYGKDNSDRRQPGKEKSLKTFNEMWANPPSQAKMTPGIWTRFTIGQAEFFLMDVRYHRSPNDDPDNSEKTMLGEEQRNRLMKALNESEAVFKFPVSGSSWNCGGVEAWNHRFTYEYNKILDNIAEHRITGVILLGGDQHACKISVRPGESWGGYDLHEWMAGQIWNKEIRQRLKDYYRGFGIITIDTGVKPQTAQLEFFDYNGNPRQGVRIPYTTPGALRPMWNSPPGAAEKPPRSIDGELRIHTSGPIWEALPRSTGETLTIEDLCRYENNSYKYMSSSELKTQISIVNNKWHLNGKITYRGSKAEGLLMNVRMVNSIFEDLNDNEFDSGKNPDVFISQIHSYIKYGIRAFTICLQGGFPGYEGSLNSAYNPDGSLRKSYLKRAEKVIRVCDSMGAAVILGCYYQRQDQVLKDEKAVKTGILNTVNWIKKNGFKNVLLEIANEYKHKGFDHEIIKNSEGMSELVRIAKQAYPELIVSVSGMGNGRMDDVTAKEVDFILIHFNGTPVEEIPSRIKELRKYGKPIVCNEDDKDEENSVKSAEISVNNGCSWGLMLNDLNQYQPFIFLGYNDSPAIYKKIRDLTDAK